mgnify:CR=1 FL=1
MRTFITLCLLFIVGGSCGWIIELFFRRIVHKKWVNPGFLAGPCLPLYGTGVVFLYLICSIDYGFIENVYLQKLFIVALITVVMTLIEYITGLIFIKGLKVKLWDYSKRPGNIQGIICPLFTFFWGVIGAAYAIFVHPLLLGAVEWLSFNEIYSFFIGIYFGVFIVDIFYSFNIVNKIRAWAKENNVVVKLEEFKLSIKLKTEKIKQKYSFLLSFKTKNGLRDELNDYNNEEKILKPENK